jgi:hypothetical protein
MSLISPDFPGVYWSRFPPGAWGGTSLKIGSGRHGIRFRGRRVPGAQMWSPAIFEVGFEISKFKFEILNRLRFAQIPSPIILIFGLLFPLT